MFLGVSSVVTMTTRCVACSRRSDRRCKGREQEKKYPLLHPLVVFFPAHISLHCPNDLNAWNRLPDVKKVLTPDGVLKIFHY